MSILNPTSAEALAVTEYLTGEIERQTKLLRGADELRDVYRIQGHIKALEDAKTKLTAPERPRTEFSGPTYDV